jgi:CheY-like chemotaxis protein
MTVNKKTVVIADDSATTVMLFSLLVERMGFKVFPAQNGLEVLKILHQSVPDAVLLDLNMPVMDGRTALRHIRQDSRLSCVPVIVATVEAGAQARYDCLRLGCSEFLSKPIRLPELHHALQVCFKDRSMVRKNLRAPFNQPVKLLVDDVSVDAYALNLSERGVFLSAGAALPVGTPLVVAFMDSGGEESLYEGVVVRRQARSYAATPGEPGIAVEFTRMSSRAAVELKHLVHRLLVSDLEEGRTTAGLIHPGPDEGRLRQSPRPTGKSPEVP